MKDFLKYMSATVVGLIVFTLITGIIGAMCIVGMIASGRLYQRRQRQQRHGNQPLRHA